MSDLIRCISKLILLLKTVDSSACIWNNVWLLIDIGLDVGANDLGEQHPMLVLQRAARDFRNALDGRCCCDQSQSCVCVLTFICSQDPQVSCLKLVINWEICFEALTLMLARFVCYKQLIINIGLSNYNLIGCWSWSQCIMSSYQVNQSQANRIYNWLDDVHFTKRSRKGTNVSETQEWKTHE